MSEFGGCTAVPPVPILHMCRRKYQPGGQCLWASFHSRRCSLSELKVMRAACAVKKPLYLASDVLLAPKDELGELQA